jgi:dienelactone hydrolase
MSATDDNLLDGFHEFAFAAGDITHRVFATGDGPPVIVMHELPGLSPAAIRFGRRLNAAGFTVYLPLLFGEPGQDDWRASYRMLCVSQEFARLAAGVSGPIVDWLRALANDVSARHGNAKIGVIGMCLTGAFAISLILERCVAAPVAAQPGVPFSALYRAVGLGRGPWMSQLNIADRDLHDAARRADSDGVSLLAARFEKDRICPAERLDRLAAVFGSRLIRHELAGGSAFDPPHATLTVEFEKAPDNPSEPTHQFFSTVVSFLSSHLR